MGTNLIHQTIDVVPELNDIVTEHYATGKHELKNLYKFLNKGSISSSYLYNNPADYLISVRAYPFWLSKFYASVGKYETFPIGVFSKKEVNVKGSKLSNQRNHISIGTIEVERKFNNFYDFAPYTKITAYVPAGFGFITLDANQVMGKIVDFRMSVDFDNGVAQLFVIVDGHVIQTMDSPIGAEITLSQTNNRDHARNMYLWGIQSIGSIAGIYNGKQETWNSRAVGTGVNIGASYIQANRHSVNAGKVSTGRNQLIAPTSIYLIIERPNPIPITEDYNKILGKPLGEYRTLSTLSGYTQVEEIHLENFKNATDNEINEIEQLLKSGVHL